MDARLPSQVYLIGDSLLWLVVALALSMMPRAMALSPGEFSAVTMEQQFEGAAGLDPLGASGLPELRVWSASAAAAPQRVSGVVISPAGIVRLGLERSEGWGRRYDVTRRSEAWSPAAGRALALLHALARRDALYLVCGRDAGRVSISGYVDGATFHILEAGDCSGERSHVVEKVVGLTAPWPKR